MAVQTQGPTQKTQRQRIGSASRAALAFLGLAGLSSLSQAACPLSDFLGIPLRTVLEALPSVLPALWHAVQPCVLGHQRLLECLLQVSVCGWQLALTLAGAA